MKTAPRSALETAEAEFLLQLRIRRLADPARLDGRGESVFRSASNTHPRRPLNFFLAPARPQLERVQRKRLPIWP
jgi:hypothetical protein